MGSGPWVGRRRRLSVAVLLSGMAHAEVGVKINSVGTMYGCGLGFGLLVGLLCWWAARRSLRLGLGVLVSYAALAIWWNLAMYLGDASVNPAIVQEQGNVYFWHQAVSVVLTVMIVGAAFTLAWKQRKTPSQPYLPH